MKVNCDIGERGSDHPIDKRILHYIDIANIACGGHSGDSNSAAVFYQRAQSAQLSVSAHLSYPDRKNFGRVSMSLPKEHLFASLNQQRALLPQVHTVKFHGALYNDAAADIVLAEQLAHWLVHADFHSVITPADSCLADAAQTMKLNIIPEAFAERRYRLHDTGRLALLERSHPLACLHTVAEALAQCQLLQQGQVEALSEDEIILCPIHAETVCIHSDADIALALAQALQDSTNA